MTTLEITVAGTTYEVRAEYNGLPSDGGPGWAIESIEPAPPNRATEREVERLAAEELWAMRWESVS